MRSIRTSLIVGSAVGALGVLAVAGFAVHRGVEVTLVKEMDRALEERARTLVSLVELTPEGIDLQFDEQEMQEFGEGGSPSYLIVRMSGDSLLYASRVPEQLDLGAPPSQVERARFRFVELGDRRLRVLDLSFFPRVDMDEDDEDEAQEDDGDTIAEADEDLHEDPPLLSLTLARGTEGIEAILARLRRLLVVIGLASALVATLLQRAIVSRSLLPLNDLAREIASVGESDLSRRVPVRDAPTETRPVTDRLNDLLGRLEAAFARERTFSADIAHELRTPLAGMRTTIEVELSRERNAAEYRRTLENSLEIVMRMQAMVQTLLELARLDAGHVELLEDRVDVADVVRRTWSELSDRAATRHLDVQASLPDRALVTTDGTLIETVVRNLLENAVAYADEGGHVHILVRNGADRTSIEIRNSGSRVPKDQAAELFDRFSRGDSARSETGLHCGLGLALVHRIASTLGLAIELETDVGEEFRVTVSMNGATHA